MSSHAALSVWFLLAITILMRIFYLFIDFFKLVYQKFLEKQVETVDIYSQAYLTTMFQNSYYCPNKSTLNSTKNVLTANMINPIYFSMRLDSHIQRPNLTAPIKLPKNVSLVIKWKTNPLLRLKKEPLNIYHL